MEFNNAIFDNFQAQTLPQTARQNKCANLNLEIKPDEFVLQNKPEEEKTKPDKKPTLKKALLFCTALSGIAAGAIFLYRKHNTTGFKHLAQNIEFKKAETAQEAVQYGRKNFGIKHYVGFEEKDVDTLNWINEGLTNVSNTMQGNLRMPKKIFYKSDFNDSGTLAGVISYSTKSKESGFFGVNKNIFSNIDEAIKEKIENCISVTKCLIKSDDGEYKVRSHFLDTKDAKSMIDKIKEFEAGNLKDFNNKVALFDTLHKFEGLPSIIVKSPFVKIEQISKILNEQGFTVKIDLDNIKQKSIDKQIAILSKLIKLTKDKTGQKITFSIKETSPFTTIYHEMGHLQDMTPRVQPTGKFKSPEEYPEELKKWLDNAVDIQIANNVSPYAATGPGEFIAETFAAIIENGKAAENTMSLYNKLNGPEIPV